MCTIRAEPQSESVSVLTPAADPAGQKKDPRAAECEDKLSSEPASRIDEKGLVVQGAGAV